MRHAGRSSFAMHRRSTMAVPGVHQGNDFLLSSHELDVPNRRGGVGAAALLRHLPQEAVAELEEQWGRQQLACEAFVQLLAPFVASSTFFDRRGRRIEARWVAEGWISSTTRASEALHRSSRADAVDRHRRRQSRALSLSSNSSADNNNNNNNNNSMNGPEQACSSSSAFLEAGRSKSVVFSFDFGSPEEEADEDVGATGRRRGAPLSSFNRSPGAAYPSQSQARGFSFRDEDGDDSAAANADGGAPLSATQLRAILDDSTAHLRPYLEQLFAAIDTQRSNALRFAHFLSYIVNGIGERHGAGQEEGGRRGAVAGSHDAFEQVAEAAAREVAEGGRGPRSRRRRQQQQQQRLVGCATVSPSRPRGGEQSPSRRSRRAAGQLSSDSDRGDSDDHGAGSGRSCLVLGDGGDQVSYVFRGEVPIFAPTASRQTSHDWFSQLQYIPEIDRMMCVSSHRIAFAIPGEAQTASEIALSTIVQPHVRITVAEYLPQFEATVTASVDRHRPIRIYQHHAKHPPRVALHAALAHRESCLPVHHAMGGEPAVSVAADETPITALHWCSSSARMWGGTRSGRVFSFGITKDHLGGLNLVDGGAALREHQHTSVVSKLLRVPPNDVMVSASLDSTVVVYDATGGARNQVLRGHTLGVTALGFSDHSNLLLTGGFDSKVLVWAENLWVAPVLSITDNVKPFVGNVIGIAGVPLTPYVAIADSAGTLKLYDLRRKDTPIFSMNVLDPENIADGLVKRDQVRSDQSGAINEGLVGPPAAGAGDVMTQSVPPLRGSAAAAAGATAKATHHAPIRAPATFASIGFTGERTRQFWLGGGRIFSYATSAEVRENPQLAYDKCLPVMHTAISEHLGLITLSPLEATIWSMRTGLPDCRHRRLTAARITRAITRDADDLLVLGHSSGLISAVRLSTGLQLQLYQTHSRSVSHLALHPTRATLISIANRELRLCCWCDDAVFSPGAVPGVQPAHSRTVPKQTFSLPMPAVACNIHPSGDLMAVCMLFQVALYSFHPQYKRWVAASAIRHGSTAELQSGTFLGQLQLGSRVAFGFDVRSSAASATPPSWPAQQDQQRGSPPTSTPRRASTVSLLGIDVDGCYGASLDHGFGSSGPGGGSSNTSGGVLLPTILATAGMADAALPARARSLSLVSLDDAPPSESAASRAFERLRPFASFVLAVADNRGQLAIWGISIDPLRSTAEHQLLSLWTNAPINHLSQLNEACALEQMRSHIAAFRKRQQSAGSPARSQQRGDEREGGDDHRQWELERELERARQQQAAIALRRTRRMEELELLREGGSRAGAPQRKDSDRELAAVAPEAGCDNDRTGASAPCSEGRSAEAAYADMDEQLAHAAAASALHAVVAPPVRCVAADLLHPFLLYTGDDLGRVTCWYVAQLDPEPLYPLSLLRKKLLARSAAGLMDLDADSGACKPPEGHPSPRRNSMVPPEVGLSTAFGPHPDPVLTFDAHAAPVVSIVSSAAPFHALMTCGQDNAVVLWTWYGEQLARLQQGPLAERRWGLHAALQGASQRLRARLRWLRLRVVVLGGIHRLLGAAEMGCSRRVSATPSDGAESTPGKSAREPPSSIKPCSQELRVAIPCDPDTTDDVFENGAATKNSRAAARRTRRRLLACSSNDASGCGNASSSGLSRSQVPWIRGAAEKLRTRLPKSLLRLAPLGEGAGPGRALSPRRLRLQQAERDEQLAAVSAQHGVPVVLRRKRIKKKESKREAILDKLNGRPDVEDLSEAENSAASSESDRYRGDGADDALDVFVRKHFARREAEGVRPRRRKESPARQDQQQPASQQLDEGDQQRELLSSERPTFAVRRAFASPLPAAVTPQPLSHPPRRFAASSGCQQLPHSSAGATLTTTTTTTTTAAAAAGRSASGAMGDDVVASLLFAQEQRNAPKLQRRTAGTSVLSKWTDRPDAGTTGSPPTGGPVAPLAIIRQHLAHASPAAERGRLRQQDEFAHVERVRSELRDVTLRSFVAPAEFHPRQRGAQRTPQLAGTIEHPSDTQPVTVGTPEVPTFIPVRRQH